MSNSFYQQLTAKQVRDLQQLAAELALKGDTPAAKAVLNLLQTTSK